MEKEKPKILELCQNDQNDIMNKMIYIQYIQNTKHMQFNNKSKCYRMDKIKYNIKHLSTSNVFKIH